MTSVEIVWAILLIVIVGLLPFVVAGLHRLWAASRNIEYYLGEMVSATKGIVRGTDELRALQDTIGVAGDLLSSGGAIHESAQTIREVLSSRIERGG